ncbi:Outer membrane protein TolC [Saccharicrinis carchari]|uniref:Outer membrane protein TolC n=1 Tax=Saccharicrinis carchari TaxID=1168039 RepID=A0A521ATA3_SACCC|nr:TolC family protein [Saccharicrinis carchari]SMO38098.1 Outer membrane protein TolC [Saccharicrinis carchari]
MMALKQLYKTSIAALLWLMAGAATIHAQQVTTGLEVAATELSLQECREMALQNNIESNIAKEQINAAAYQVAAYRANYLPNISATGLYLYNDATLSKNIEGGQLPTFMPSDGAGGVAPNGGFAFMPDIPLELELSGTYNASVKVEQAIYTGGKVTAAYKMAQKGHEIAQANEKLSEVQVIVLCDEAYWNCVKVKALIKSAVQYKETLQELQRMVQEAVDAGMKHRKDILSVQVKMNEAELNLARAQNGYQLAVMNLNHIIGLPLSQSTKVADSFEVDTAIDLMPESPGATNNIDITLRPEYKLLTKQVEMKEQEVNLVRSDFLPNVGVMGAYGYTNGLKLNGEKLINSSSFSALLSVNIPIFNWAEGRNKVKGAKLQSTIAQMQLHDSQQRMTLEATKSINELNEAQLEVILTAKSVEQALENMEMSKDRYENGMETLADYMEAQAMWQNAMSMHIGAKAALNLAKTKYLKATGKL